MVDYTRPSSPPPSGGGVSMSKVTLTKSAPSVSLTKGRGAGGQMRVNLNWESGRRGLFSKGSAVDPDLGCPWETADGSKGVVTLYPQGAAPIEVRLDEHAQGARSCAIALLTNQGGSLTVQREIRYLPGVQRDLDGAYGWGLNWTSGRK